MDGKIFECETISLVKADDLLVYRQGTVGATHVEEDFFKDEKGVRIGILGLGEKCFSLERGTEEYIQVVGEKVPSGMGFRLDITKSDGKIRFKEVFTGKAPERLYKHLKRWGPVSIEFIDP